MELFSQLTPTTTVLTPNRRLTAIIKKKYIEHQLAKGLVCWKTLDILPLYPAWLERTWKEWTAKTLAAHPLLLSSEQEILLWEKILRAAPQNEFLFQLSDTSQLAKSAWETLKRWRVSLADPALTVTEDSRAFLSWAQTFKKQCKKNHWLDQHSLADEIANHIKSSTFNVPPHLLLVGFTEITPQYQNLLKQYEQRGTRIEFYTLPTQNQTVKNIALTDTEDEIYAMARWAKAKVTTSKSIGCIFPNLETLREPVVRIFSEVFGSQPFNISAGKPLTTYPIIHDALLLLTMAASKLSLKKWSRLLRSPFLGESTDEQNKRAHYDNQLRQANLTTITLKELLKAEHPHSMLKACPLFAKRLRQYFDFLPDAKIGLSIAEWIPLFNQLLKTLGWPGQRSVNSEEYQVIQNAWLPLLARLATFNAFLEPLDFFTALHYLNRLAANTIFQPESPDAPVQLLGLLEAAGVPFEHAWVMGLDDTHWPPKPRPNPFLPIRMQKELKMPNASAERELIYCEQLTQQFLQNNAHLIFSYPTKKEDMELRPSSLLNSFITEVPDPLDLAPFTRHNDILFKSQQLASFIDEIAPPLSHETLLGGVNIFKTQAACPFKAFAELRLHAKKMEDTTVGLRKLDRGNLVHVALEWIWRQLNDSNTLVQMSDEALRQLIKEGAVASMKKVLHWDEKNPSRYLLLECQRLEKLVWDWLQYEKTRPPFRVIALEHPIQINIGPITAEFRIDRIDELLLTEGNKQLIIDYKTGKNIRRTDWFGNRLNEPQLPLYCIANSTDTIGLAFAKIHPDHIELQGVSGILLSMKGVELLAAVKQADATLWDEQIKHWQQTMTQLGEDFYQGLAHVDPKEPQTCRLCDLKALCRIDETQLKGEENDEPA